jgi:hypothetical protein
MPAGAKGKLSNQLKKRHFAVMRARSHRRLKGFTDQALDARQSLGATRRATSRVVFLE